MSLKRFPVDDSIVRIALVAPEEFLLPGRELDTVTAMAEHFRNINKKIGEVGIWFLTKEQKASFAGDFSSATPSHYASIHDHRLTRLSLLQVAFSLILGTPFGLPDQRNGVIVQDIFPNEDKTKRINSIFDSKENLDFHTDQAYNANFLEVPKVVTLACIRNEERAATRVATLSVVLANLSASDIDVLKRPRFIFYTGRSHENLGVRIGPVLAEVDGICVIRVAIDMTPLDENAESALRSLRKIMEMVACNIVLDPGDILVLPNWFATHARNPFIPSKSEDKRRWLQRIFIK